jgi:hypothetical protein
MFHLRATGMNDAEAAPFLYDNFKACAIRPEATPQRWLKKLARSPPAASQSVREYSQPSHPDDAPHCSASTFRFFDRRPDFAAIGLIALCGDQGVKSHWRFEAQPGN